MADVKAEAPTSGSENSAASAAAAATTAKASEDNHGHHHHHHQHQHQHHHRTLHQTLLGKGSEAPGRRVLVGVDGSDFSNYALEWYLDHVWQHEDYVVLLNCPEVDDPMRHHTFQFDREKLTTTLKEEQDQIHQLLELYRDKLLKIGAHGKVRAVATKHVGHALVRVQEEEGAEFIVMGGRGKGTLRRTFMGSVSDYVVHHAHVPVLVCRNTPHGGSHGNKKAAPAK